MTRVPTADFVTADEFEREFKRRIFAAGPLSEVVLCRSDYLGAELREHGAAEWTNALLNILLKYGQELGFLTYYPYRRYFARGGNGRANNSSRDQPQETPSDLGEYLHDACWTRYVYPSKDWVMSLREGKSRTGHELILICESEWASGRWGVQEPEIHVGDVLDDFAKLKDTRAPLKVLIFGFQSNTAGGIASFEDIVSLCRRAAEPFLEGEEYVLFGWPADATWEDRMAAMRTDRFGARSV